MPDTLTTAPDIPVDSRPPRKRGLNIRLRPASLLTLVLSCVGALVVLAPFLLVLLNAFKSPADYSTNGPLAWPERLDLGPVRGYLEIIDFPRALTNSIVISALVAVIGVLFSVLAAYAIGVGRIRMRTGILAILLLATMIPQEALVYPLFYIAQATGTLNTIWSVTIIFIVLQGAFGTYLLSGVLGTFPKELLEAARMDGAGRWRILWTVVVPVIRPTLSVLMVFFFIWTWNEFYIPVVLLNDQSAQTIPIALATLRGQHTVDMTVVNAGSFLSLIPTILFFLIFQRTLSNGVTAGAVK
ncbi:carbohydrate ABC transporter permease [Brachybacterium sp. GPGPB12]|uniref:carbohydrate ABC transporter permease n=1 Tax=Brachybacterium sp. GPGPB12 TaxID=3023517 RepID=UPI0031346471